MRAFLLLAAAAALLAQQPLGPTARLIRAREMLVERDKRLPDYTCVQTVERRYLKRLHPQYPYTSCVELRSLKAGEWALQGTDRLRLDIKVSQGMEIGSWKDSPFTEGSIFNLTRGGPYSTGLLGSLILDIFVNGGAAYYYVGGETYGYQVPLASSHYQVSAGNDWVTTAFSGLFWLDSNSCELKRILAEGHDLPFETGGCDFATTVDYRSVRVGTGEFLLPQKGTLRLLMRDETEIETTAVYSNCREFLGESTIRFNEAPAATPANTPETPVTPVPPGLHLSLALTEPINTDTAAAGDVVKAKVRNTVRDPKYKVVVVPRGATVQGRIVQMQHWLEKPRYFSISLLLERLDVGAVSRPLYAELDPGHKPGPLILPPLGQSPLVAVLPFATDSERHVVPAGYQMNWVTVEPPPPSEEKR